MDSKISEREPSGEVFLQQAEAILRIGLLVSASEVLSAATEPLPARRGYPWEIAGFTEPTPHESFCSVYRQGGFVDLRFAPPEAGRAVTPYEIRTRHVPYLMPFVRCFGTAEADMVQRQERQRDIPACATQSFSVTA